MHRVFFLRQSFSKVSGDFRLFSPFISQRVAADQPAALPICQFRSPLLSPLCFGLPHVMMIRAQKTTSSTPLVVRAVRFESCPSDPFFEPPMHPPPPFMLLKAKFPSNQAVAKECLITYFRRHYCLPPPLLFTCFRSTPGQSLPSSL